MSYTPDNEFRNGLLEKRWSVDFASGLDCLHDGLEARCRCSLDN
jgi:hypothetical protein